MGSSFRCLSDRRCCFGMLRGSLLPRAQGRRVDPQLRPSESGIAAPIHPSAWKADSPKFEYRILHSPGSIAPGHRRLSTTNPKWAVRCHGAEFWSDWRAAEPDLVPVGIVIRNLAHTVGVGLPLRALHSPIGNLGNECIEVVDQDGVH